MTKKQIWYDFAMQQIHFKLAVNSLRMMKYSRFDMILLYLIWVYNIAKRWVEILNLCLFFLEYNLKYWPFSVHYSIIPIVFTTEIFKKCLLFIFYILAFIFLYNWRIVIINTDHLWPLYYISTLNNVGGENIFV